MRWTTKAAPILTIVGCLSLAHAGCGGAGTRAPTSAATDAAQSDLSGWHYTIRVDPRLTRLDASVCFDGEPPPALVPGRPEAAHLVLRAELREGSDSRRLTVENGRIDLDGADEDACVRYLVDLDGAASARFGGTMASRSGTDLMASPGIWLWRPPRIAPTARVRARFVLPPGMRVSVPWPREGRTYRLDESAFAFVAYAAFGFFDVERIDVPGATLEVARLDGPSALSAEGLRRWIRAAGTAEASLYGRFPVSRAQIVVLPTGASDGNGPVPFGIVGRGGGASIALLLAADATDDEVATDWVAVHEMTHLAMPYVRREDAWLSEGVATYYQEVLRARADMRAPLEAWHALDEGFRRGASDGTGRALASESESVFRTGAFDRVYWGGAAFALAADVELRSRSGRQESLDTVLERLSRCCLSPTREWTGPELLAKMDELAGHDVFRRLARRTLRSTSFPRVTATYDLLRLRRTDDGIDLVEGSAVSSIRDAIMAPPLALQRVRSAARRSRQDAASDWGDLSRESEE
ncbi:MAG: hypothetical protein IT379_27560 [Deltaproteobacteria bacterium]|nr:hypothetical protein [Deltaproteobacteria bacterium]